MNPETQTIEQATAEEAHLEEQYIRQVEDHSRSAQDILLDQQEERLGDQPSPLFVP